MPAASSKPAPQTSPSEGQDTLKQLVGVVEKKIRNLEKRKTKLDGYRDMVSSGKSLNKDQEEAVSHFLEVGASLEFAKELSKQFTTILNDATKASKREAKREKQHRYEQDLGRISDVLLLQNVLSYLGEEHVRSDFLAGTNGALHLEEPDLNHLDEFYKLVNPSRGSDSGEGEETTEEQSFDKKLEKATHHLDNYLKEDEREVCETSYKELFHLVQRIHKCGYLDSIPEPPEEAAVPVAPEETSVAAPAYEAPQVEQEEEEYEETYQEPAPEYPEAINEAPSESYFSGSASEQIQQTQPTMQSVQTDTTQLQPAMPSEPQQTQQQQLNDMVAPSRVADLPPTPEPIEMPPPKPQHHHDVNEVLAPVLGSFNFVQDSMLDYDSPHMDPAVVAVSQSYIPSTFTNSVQSSTNSAELSQSEQSTQSGVQSLDTQQQLGALSQLPADQPYQQQARYDASQSSYSSQGLADQTPYATQSLEGASTAYGGQADLSSTGGVEYGSSQTSSTSATLKDLPEFPNPPVETQQDQSVLQGSMPHSHTSTQYGSTDGYSQSLGSSQLGSEGVSTGLSSQLTSGSSSSPLTISDPSQATIPLPGEQTSADTQQGSIPQPPKSTMNASAPPFQMTNSMRSSPQMQGMQASPPGQVGQAQDMGGYQGTLDQSQSYNHSVTGDVRSRSPGQDDKVDHSGVHSSDNQGNSYQSSYQPYFKNGRGKPRGPNPNYRGNNRGGPAPFIRGGPRYGANTSPRGSFNNYVPREPFQQRGPDVSYNPNARYGGFNQVQDQQNFYSSRRGGGMPRGAPRGGRGAPGPRNQVPYRGGRGSFGKPSSQVTA